MKYFLAFICLLACACGGTGLIYTDSNSDEEDASSVSCPISGSSGVKESSNNYTINSSCAYLQGVSVTITITQDIVTTNGFGFQLNADGMLTSKVGWQQYVLAVDTSGNLFAAVDNWDNNNKQIFNQWHLLFTMPQKAGAPYVPKGYEFTFSLSSDSKGNITGVSYYVVDGSGNVLANYLLALNTLQQYDGGAYSNGDVGPIGDITLDVVGFDNSQSTIFTSGAGNIIYHAAAPLTVIGGPASCTYNFGTGESSNSLYGDLPTEQPNGDYVQNFTYCQK